MTSVSDQRQQRAVAMAGPGCDDTGCNCIRGSVCTSDRSPWILVHILSRQDTDHTSTPPRSRQRRHVCRPLPSTSSIMEVLYPSSYLGAPLAFPDPPSYFSGDTQPSTVQGDLGERTRNTPLLSSTTAEGGTLIPSSRPDPLIEAPSLTGVPSPGAPFARNQPAEPNVPIASLGVDVLEEAEPPPAYSRFDDSRSHPPVASDVLGPYPPIPVLNPPA